jgi:hypothetical protein
MRVRKKLFLWGEIFFALVVMGAFCPCLANGTVPLVTVKGSKK